MMRAAGYRVETERWSWPLVVGRPHPGLRGLLIRGYWGVPAEVAPHRLLVPATASVPLVLKITDSACRPPAFLHGVHDRFVVMDGDCAPSYVEVVMAPLGAYRLLGRPLRELGGVVVDMEAVFGADGRRLLEAIREQTSWRGRFAVLDAFLLRAAERGPAPSLQVSRAWDLLAGSGAPVPIGHVAAEVGWSHKHLISKFTEQVGLTPKTVARLARFQRVLTEVRRGGVPGWGRLAAAAGYADQPHLIREFREFTGSTPAAYLRRAAAAS